MAPVFLIGGGRDDAQVRASHAPFVAACRGGPIVAFALEDPERWERALRLAGATDPRCVSAPPTEQELAGAAGVFVGGGWTPGYQEALSGWQAPALPYAGFSAGASVASARAIVGGWRLGERAVCAEEAGEDIDQLDVRDGLGLVPFAVDVHATQWGTLTRLVHAVAGGLVPAGWAIDEGTVLVVDNGRLHVEGLGGAYRVARQDGEVVVSVHP
jgi:cyanophycinase